MCNYCVLKKYIRITQTSIHQYTIKLKINQAHSNLSDKRDIFLLIGVGCFLCQKIVFTVSPNKSCTKLCCSYTITNKLNLQFEPSLIVYLCLGAIRIIIKHNYGARIYVTSIDYYCILWIKMK